MTPAAALLLCGAIGCDVSAAVSLKLAEGFTRPVPSVVVVVGYIGSVVFLGLAIDRGLDIGIGYALWSAAGTTLVALAGAVFFRERLGIVALVGIAFIVVGAILVNLGTAHLDA
ncbi:DMT family transporter [Williamsia sp. M5A3_1d]